MSEHDALTSAPVQETAQQKNTTHAEAFSFGDPIPVLDRRELLDYVECVQMDRWYEPPVSFDGLARTYRAAVHHSSPIAVKRDILSSTFIPHRLLGHFASVAWPPAPDAAPDAGTSAPRATLDLAARMRGMWN